MHSLDPYLPLYANRTSRMTASEVRALFSVVSRPEVVSLAGGMPFISGLPLDTIGELMRELVAEQGASALQYGSGQGVETLREQICGVMALEGIGAQPADVTVTVGSQQGLDLLTRVFCNPGDVIVAEAPSYVGALSTFAAYEVEVSHVAMDDQGLIPAALEERLAALKSLGRHVKFLYTIPNYHNPAGVTLAVARRAEILEICQRFGVLVVEDNPYGLLSFDGTVQPAIRSLDDNVVYLGSFSKTFAPGLRVGWVLAPHWIREKLVLAAEASMLCPPALTQMAVSSYLSQHDWQHQIVEYRALYAERCDAALAALGQYLPSCSWTTPSGGFFIWVSLPESLDSKALLPLAVSNLVAYVPGTAFYADGSGAGNLRLSFCYPTAERIHEGVRRLSRAIMMAQDAQGPLGVAERTTGASGLVG